MTNPNLFFSTPVWASQINNYKETNEIIYDYIKTKQKNDESGIVKSNLKGWHSRDFDLTNNTAPYSFSASAGSSIGGYGGGY